MPRRKRSRERPRASAETHVETPGPVFRRGPGGLLEIATESEARDLAAALLTAGRRLPFVVVTTAAGCPDPFVDAARLKADLGDLAEVCVLPTGAPSWEFSRAMPDETQVYGGASRVYSPDLAWVEQPRASTLRMAFSAPEGERVRERLAEDALRAAHRAGLVGAPTGGRPRESVGGTVRGLAGGHAFVELDDGRPVVVSEALTGAGLPIDRLLRFGQRIEGFVDDTGKRLDVTSLLPDEEGARRLVERTYQDGDVVVVEVAAVGHDTVTVQVVPGVRVDVDRGAVTGNDLDDLTDLFTRGEPVLTRYVVEGPGGFTLRLDDVDDDVESPVPAPALLDGGPPWLALPEPAAPRPVDEAPPPPDDVATAPEESSREPVVEPPAVVRPTPAHLAARCQGTPAPLPPPRPAPAEPPPRSGTALKDTQLQLALQKSAREHAEEELRKVRRHVADLGVEADQLNRDLGSARAEVERLEAQLAHQKAKYRKADRQRQRAQHEAANPDAGAFADPVEQLRYEVYVAWARTVPAAEKADLPLAGYSVGGGFVASIDASGASRAKVVEVVTQVVTGRAETMPGRQHHPLRQGAGPTSGQVVRGDGAKCYRVAVQVNAPSARRLHYWRLPDGSVELSRVVLHDDTGP